MLLGERFGAKFQCPRLCPKLLPDQGIPNESSDYWPFMIYISETLAGQYPESVLCALAERDLTCSFPPH